MHKIFSKNKIIGVEDQRASMLRIIYNLSWFGRWCYRWSSPQEAGVLRAVNVNWYDGGWNVNANELDDPNEWNDGNQVFSRNYAVSPVT